MRNEYPPFKFTPCHSHYSAIPCIDNEFRLTGGSETSGRVEVCVDGAWGNVCSESFDDLTAAKICKQIGLKGTLVHAVFCDHTIIVKKVCKIFLSVELFRKYLHN